jgi:hypothetical protein
MNEWIMDRGNGASSRNWRLGMALALVAVLYIAAVILFIILY